MKELLGVGASPGKAVGKARVWRANAESARAELPPAGTPQEEWQRLEAARAALRHTLETLARESTAESTPQGSAAAELFAAHIDILDDLSLVEMLQEGVHQERLRAETAVENTFGEFVALFSALDDPLFAARANDVRDLQAQLLALLTNPAEGGRNALYDLPANTILLADDLMPSEVARLDPACVAGIALAHGSRLAHASILARSMGIPMVCQLGETALTEAAGRDCLIDGESGRFIIEPDPQSIAQSTAASAQLAVQGKDTDAHPLTGVQQTGDGVAVAVLANLNTMEEVGQIAHFGADGIGLLRTEFLFAREREAPSVARQAEQYATILRALDDTPLYVRAFDFGGDKRMAWHTVAAAEEDAELRGVRFLLAHPELLRNQYLALLQAVAQCQQEADKPTDRVRYLLPMVALPEEIDVVRAFLDEVAAAEGWNDTTCAIEIGAMIEIPSAALMAGEIASRCAMISIGSNDLAQFLFAGDRSQRDAAARADALHPAVLRTIGQICRAAAAHNRPVSLCGEMAGNPLATPLLLGLGVTELSVTPSAAPVVKGAVGRYTLEECRALAAAALAAPDLAAVHALLGDFAAQRE